MNKIFCVSCGFKILYEIKKPKFCSSCGTNVNSLNASTETRESDEPESDLSKVDINKLKSSVSVEYNSQKTNLQQLWGSVTPDEAVAPPDKFSRPTFKGPQGQELLDQTIKDCGSSRRQDIDG
jgi:hypothetical protein